MLGAVLIRTVINGGMLVGTLWALMQDPEAPFGVIASVALAYVAMGCFFSYRDGRYDARKGKQVGR
jgi:hypothetical protein